MILPTKPRKVAHTKILIKSKPQGSVYIQGRIFLPQVLTSIPEVIWNPDQTSPVSEESFTGNENDKTANSFWGLSEGFWKDKQKTDFLEYTVSGPNTVPSKKTPVPRCVWGVSEETKTNVRVPSRLLHQPDFCRLNNFFFLLCYISEMFSPILGRRLASRREVAWPGIGTQLVLYKCSKNSWSTREWIHEYPTNPGMNGGGANEWHFPPVSPWFLWTWLVALPGKTYLSLRSRDYLKGTCQKLNLFYSSDPQGETAGSKGKV